MAIDAPEGLIKGAADQGVGIPTGFWRRYAHFPETCKSMGHDVDYSKAPGKALPGVSGIIVRRGLLGKVLVNSSW